MKRGRTYVVIVLDRSGSMMAVKEQTVKGYNEQVSVLLEESSKPDRGETFASLVTFNGQVKEDFFNAPIEILREMHPSQYEPSGWTAMYDAVGYTIDRLCKETDITDEFNSYLVVVISDGEENQSRFWTAQKLADKIKEVQNTNRWTFTYIGANQDLSQVRETLQLKAGNTLSYDSTARGTAAAFSSNARQMKKWFDMKDSQLKSGGKGYSAENYFDGAENADDLLKQDTQEKA